MTANGWLQIAVFALAVLLVTKPLGLYLVAVYEGRVRWLAAVERACYRAGRRRSRRGAALDPVRGGDAGVQRGEHAADLRGRSGCSTSCRSTRRGSAR